TFGPGAASLSPPPALFLVRERPSQAARLTRSAVTASRRILAAEQLGERPQVGARVLELLGGAAERVVDDLDRVGGAGHGRRLGAGGAQADAQIGQRFLQGAQRVAGAGGRAAARGRGAARLLDLGAQPGHGGAELVLLAVVGGRPRE